MSAGRVVGGAVAGLVLGWVWIVAVLLGAYALAGEDETWTPAATVVVVLLALPVLVGLAVLLRGPLRRAGQGLVLGVATGLLLAGASYVALLLPDHL